MQHSGEKRVALVTGITGQDGAYLAELLLSKGYEVHGIKRRASLFNTDRIDHLYRDPHQRGVKFRLHYGDMTDATNLIRIMQDVRPDEIYNLAAQSHVQVSFETPEYTANADALGTLRLLEAMRILNLGDKVRFYQASSSELYGRVQETPQNEKTPFYPRSPYAVAKLYSFWITVNYREAYNMFACNGILFNHESPVRGETFVTRKITRAVARIAMGLEERLYLGNLNAKRDWGHARDYVEGMWLILQQERPEDFVLATGEQRSVREFVEFAFSEVGIGIDWKGKGLNEKGIVKSIKHSVSGIQHFSRGSIQHSTSNIQHSDSVFGRSTQNSTFNTQHVHHNLKVGDAVIHVDPRYFRPTEVDSLLGDASKARRRLGWKPKVKFKELVKEMVREDLVEARREHLCSREGFRVMKRHE